MKYGVCALVALGCGGNHAGPQDAPVDDNTPDNVLDCQMTHGTRLSVRKIATVVGPATLATAPPVDDGRLFVLEQYGRIRIIKGHGLTDAPFLDVSNLITSGGELGLLGLAFHPSYATNGTFFVFYTTNTGGQLHDVLARYQVSSDPDVADPTGTVVLSIDDFAANHNGGMIGFGPDGYLYLGTGDGGGAGDPMRTAQNPNALLGKMLRIDVDNKLPGLEYGIPPGNPFASGAGGRPEVFALGLRNPWRWSFDKLTGDLWIADVGQGTIEEVDVIPAGVAGLNFGWSEYEGDSCFNTPCDPTGKTSPVWTRTHDKGWCSIIGSAVYRGSCYPDLTGQLFVTDYCSTKLMTAPVQTAAPLEALLSGPFPDSPSAIYSDARGELYYTTAPGNGGNGDVYHLEAGP